MPETRDDHHFSAQAAWQLARGVGQAWLADGVLSMGAALAYYTLFSLAPLLLIVVSVAGLVFGEDAARGEIQSQLSALMGSRGAGAVQDLLASVDEPAEGLAAAALGVLLLLVGATTVFAELQDALDRIWRVPARPGRGGWFGLLRQRLLSFGLILAIGFLLTVSSLLSAGLSALQRGWHPTFWPWLDSAVLANAVIGFLLVVALFAGVYKVMPSARVAWRDVWTGALFTAVLFTLGKMAIGWYVGRSGAVSGFGAAGSLVVVLIWVYWSAQIFLLGAVFTWVYANLFGSLRPRTSPPAPPAPAA